MDSSNQFTPQQVTQNMELLQEMLTCGFEVSTWCYDADGNLIYTNARDDVFDKMFEHDGCKAYMLTQTDAGIPVILSAKLGLMWGGAYMKSQEQTERIYVIGPVFNSSVSLESINRALDEASREYEISTAWMPLFRELIKQIPVISSVTFFQYVLMLHCCVTGEKLSRSALHFQKSPAEAETDTPGGSTNRHQTWMAEQALLANVKEGNLNFQSQLERAGLLSNGIRVSAETPLMQARMSEVVFTSLCTRAAIEGGMSPDTAYTLGDSYIQSLISCKSLTDMRNIGHSMYEDFIYRVHALHTDKTLSAEILSCRDYIDMHPTEDLSLEKLADRIGYSAYYLSRKFKKETGCSINDYIRKVRIERAKSMLSFSDEPIGQIAEDLHFSSASHFADAFRKAEGILPQAYRKQTRKV